MYTLKQTQSDQLEIQINDACFEKQTAWILNFEKQVFQNNYTALTTPK